MYLLRTTLLLTIVLFLLVVTTSHTNAALTLPTSLHHEGLTINQPLTINHNAPTTIAQLTLTFGEQDVITVKETNQPEIIAENIISPAPVTKKKTIGRLIPTTEVKGVKISNTPSPTSTLTPTITPTPTSTPPVALSNGGLDAEKLFSMSNSYRQTRGLPPFQKDERSCQLAAARAPEINAEIAGGHMHSGLRARNLPYWNSENIISMRTEEEAFNWWVNDKIHHDAIVGNYTYSCVACHGNACAQEFTNFQPK